MFRSACSLRSTQCAALIALATAAGISRFEPGSNASTASTHAERDTSVRVATIRTLALRAAYFQFALQTIAPWLRFDSPALATLDAATPHAMPSTGTAVAQSTDSATVPTALPAAEPYAFPVFPVPALSAREHAFPFAVGPPRSEVVPNLRAPSTFVPCDSTARQVPVPPVSRIAPALSATPSPVARLARQEFAGPRAARPFARTFAPPSGASSPRLPASPRPSPRLA